MDHLGLGLGTLWLLLTVAAAAILGTDFILHEIRILLRDRHESKSK